MFKILTIIGARPQIIKAAAISRAISNSFGDQIQELILHTGQHYDENMSKVFFEELGIPRPDYNLSVGSGSHGKQTASMLQGIEEVLLKEKPDAVVVYGDTNSTLAAAVAASKLHIHVVHVEAGLRSYNKTMPEEVNRIMCDHVSSMLFSPTSTGLDNLKKEGFKEQDGPFHMDRPGIYHCGDVMYDNSKHFSALSDEKSTILEEHSLAAESFVLSTVHRPANTDNPLHLSSIFEAFLEVIELTGLDVVLPLHPRTANLLEGTLSPELYSKVKANAKLKIIPPVSFLDIIALEKNAKLIATDSGGVQKEAFFFQRPCVILRPETEWVELVDNGNAIIADWRKEDIVSAVQNLLANDSLVYPDYYGNGQAAEFICNEMLQNLA